MTKFTDGPAADATLFIRRAPLFLRVAVDRAGECRALDQLDAQPRPGDVCYVYVLAEPPPPPAHVRGGNTEFYGTFQQAKYRFWPDQPGPHHTQTTEAWRAWTTVRYKGTKAWLMARPAPPADAAPPSETSSPPSADTGPVNVT